MIRLSFAKTRGRAGHLWLVMDVMDVMDVMESKERHGTCGPQL